MVHEVCQLTQQGFWRNGSAEFKLLAQGQHIDDCAQRARAVGRLQQDDGRAAATGDPLGAVRLPSVHSCSWDPDQRLPGLKQLQQQQQMSRIRSHKHIADCSDACDGLLQLCLK